MNFARVSQWFFISHGGQKTRGKDHLFPHLNSRIKGKVDPGHKLSSETKLTNWSQSGNEQQKLKTFCSSSAKSSPWPLHPRQFILDPVSFHIY